MVDKEDNKNVLIDLCTFIMIEVDGKILSTDYTSVEDRMVYDEAQDKTQYLLINDEVKESKIKKKEISEGQMPNGEQKKMRQKEVKLEEIG